MILFENYVIPWQIFKCLDTYYYRPISIVSPSIHNPDLGYNPLKFKRSLSYNPKTDLEKISKVIKTKVTGQTVEKFCTIMYAFSSVDSSLNHFYFDYEIDELY